MDLDELFEVVECYPEIAQALLEKHKADLAERWKRETGGNAMANTNLLAGSVYLHYLSQSVDQVEQDMWVSTPERAYWLSAARQYLKGLTEALERLDAEMKKPLPPCSIPFGSKVRVIELFTKGQMGGPVVGSEGVTFKPDHDAADHSLVWVKFKTPLKGHDGSTWLYDPERPDICYALPPRCVEVLAKKRK